MEKANVDDEPIMGKGVSVGVCSCLRLGLIYPTQAGKIHRDEGWKHSDLSGNFQWYCGRPGHYGLGYLQGGAICDILEHWCRTTFSPIPRRLADLVTCAVYGWRNFTYDKGAPTGAWQAELPSVLSSGPAGAPAEKAGLVPVPFLTSDAFSRKDWVKQYGHLDVPYEAAMIMKYELQTISPRLSGLIGTAPVISTKTAQKRLAENLNLLSCAVEAACEGLVEPNFDTADLGTAVAASGKKDEEVTPISFKHLVGSTPVIDLSKFKHENIHIGYETGYPIHTGSSNVFITVDQSNDGTPVDDFEVGPPEKQPAKKPHFVLPSALLMLKNVLETLSLSPEQAVEILTEHHRNSMLAGTGEPKKKEEDREAEWDAIEI